MSLVLINWKVLGWMTIYRVHLGKTVMIYCLLNKYTFILILNKGIKFYVEGLGFLFEPDIDFAIVV